MSDTGLVLGGKTKYGFFASGVLDMLLEAGISFSWLISTSGTARAAVNFLSGQAGRYFRLAEQEANGQGGLLRRFAGGQEEKKASQQVEPFDYPAYFSSGTRHELVLTDYDTGKPAYFYEKKSKKRLDALIEASEAEPFFAHEVKVDNGEYFSGVLSDAIPLKRAVEIGCKKQVLVLSEAYGQLPLLEQAASSFYWLAFRKHPEFAQCAANYGELVKKQLAQVKAVKSGGGIFVIQPVADFVEKNVSPEAAYAHGRNKVQQELSDLRTFLKD